MSDSPQTGQTVLDPTEVLTEAHRLDPRLIDLAMANVHRTRLLAENAQLQQLLTEMSHANDPTDPMPPESPDPEENV